MLHASGCKREACQDVFAVQFRIIVQDILLRHAVGQPTKYIIHTYAQPSTAGPAATLARLQSDLESPVIVLPYAMGNPA